jgi:hypothetical protein
LKLQYDEQIANAANAEKAKASVESEEAKFQEELRKITVSASLDIFKAKFYLQSRASLTSSTALSASKHQTLLMEHQRQRGLL